VGLTNQGALEYLGTMQCFMRCDESLDSSEGTMRKLKNTTLARLMQRIRSTEGQFIFSYVTNEPGITYRDPAGNYIAVYERSDWNGNTWCECYLACDPAKMYPCTPETERNRLIALTKPRTLGGPARFWIECENCESVHAQDDDCEYIGRRYSSYPDPDRERWGNE
jgi:hypothetical protein